MVHAHELVIPPTAEKDESARELLRAWGVAGGLHVTLAPDLWDEPGNWGIALADITRHLSDAYAELNGIDKAETIQRIRMLFDAELDSPTDEPTGHFVRK